MIYRSKRIGKGGKEFILYKLKTMKDVSGSLSTAADDPRLTKIGKFLRKWKIDEIPSVLNWIKGDLSTVGSRPEVPQVIDLLTDYERTIILSRKPGLFCLEVLADWHEEDELSGELDPHRAYLERIWPLKRKLQIYYVKNRNIIFDLKIILRILCKLFRLNLFKIKINVEGKMLKL